MFTLINYWIRIRVILNLPELAGSLIGQFRGFLSSFRRPLRWLLPIGIAPAEAGEAMRTRSRVEQRISAPTRRSDAVSISSLAPTKERL